jgi:leader peptidase (prepilin peptidase) / N-methyltransferase
MEPGPGHDLWLDLVLLAVVLPVAVVDLRRRLIPNAILLPAAAAALAILAVTSPRHLAEHAVAAAAAGGLLLAPALARPAAMGMGDVKLAAVMGLCLGRSVVVAMLCALLAGTAAGAVIIARRGVGEGRRTVIPLGPFLAAGAVIGMLPRPALLGW